MADRQILLPQSVIDGHAFGRNINHDRRSLAFRVPREAKPKTVFHDIFIPVLNQKQLGKCVAETGAELLGTERFWTLLSASMKQTLSRSVDTADAWTTDLYRELTKDDTFPGFWEPTDTGSDGLTLGKVFVKRGFASGYRHATTIGEAEAAIQESPFAIGTMFLAGMMTPRKDGTVKVSGTAQGGHEYLCFGRDAERDLWWFRNHWTRSWGLNGTFAYDTPGLQKLLGMQGDITVLVPASEAKPEPTPLPQPETPGSVPQPAWDRLEPFMEHPRSYKNQEQAVAELQRLKKAATG